jgi:ribosome-associated protein
MAQLGSGVTIAPRRGLPGGLQIPESELVERFSRSSGPGGQSVNTADSRVELRWNVLMSAAIDDDRRAQLVSMLGSRLTGNELIVFASEHRAQLQNRIAARARLTMLVSNALEPPPPTRRATRPSRRAQSKRMDVKTQRGQIKAGRGRVRPDD